MNEIRFAIKDGLTIEQIRQFADPKYEQWQMDICRIGLRNGLTMDELKGIINTGDYSLDNWGAAKKTVTRTDRTKKITIARHVVHNCMPFIF